jgi:hypothetical protein
LGHHTAPFRLGTPMTIPVSDLWFNCQGKLK